MKLFNFFRTKPVNYSYIVSGKEKAIVTVIKYSGHRAYVRSVTGSGFAYWVYKKNLRVI